MDRLEALNRMAVALGARRYLEIGVQDGVVFKAVQVPERVGVDPDPRSRATVHLTSDEYFARLDPSERFDLVFIDGLHHADQVRRDLHNALRHLMPGGVVMLHDCDPPDEQAGRRVMCPGQWCGDVWRAWVDLRVELKDDATTFTVNADLGLGIVYPHRPARVLAEDALHDGAMIWAHFQARRPYLLGLVSPSDFKRWARQLPALPR